MNKTIRYIISGVMVISLVGVTTGCGSKESKAANTASVTQKGELKDSDILELLKRDSKNIEDGIKDNKLNEDIFKTLKDDIGSVSKYEESVEDKTELNADIFSEVMSLKDIVEGYLKNNGTISNSTIDMAKSVKSDIDALMSKIAMNGSASVIEAKLKAKGSGGTEEQIKDSAKRALDAFKSSHQSGGSASTTVNQKQVNSAPTQTQPQSKPSTSTSNTSASTGSYVGSIQTKYGNHTYGCKTQAEYDAVMEKVESAVASIKAGNVKVSPYYDLYRSGKRAEDYKKGSKEYTYLKRLDQTTGKFISSVSKQEADKILAVKEVIVNFNQGVSDPGTGAPDSAYDVLFRGVGDCDANAQVASAVYDAIGISTQVRGTASHAWYAIKAGGQWWSASLNSAALSGEAITDPTY